jgi:two-component system response regulator YesN
MDADGGSMYKALIVDDEKIEREGIKFLIETMGLNLTTAEAENGVKALDYLQAHEVDVLFTDIRMPFMDGLALASQAKKLNPKLKVIIVSAFGEFEYAKQAIQIHVVHYLLKPVEVAEFLEVVTQVVTLCDEDREQREQTLKLQQVSEMGNRYVQQSSAESPRKVIGEVIKVIHRDYGQDISLDSLAEKACLSPSYLSHLFKKETGASLVKYITCYRLDKAGELLRSTNKKISDISHEVGYTNFAYFCSIFKNYYGKTPAKYREGDPA